MYNERWLWQCRPREYSWSGHRMWWVQNLVQHLSQKVPVTNWQTSAATFIQVSGGPHILYSTSRAGLVLGVWSWQPGPKGLVLRVLAAAHGLVFSFWMSSDWCRASSASLCFAVDRSVRFSVHISTLVVIVSQTATQRRVARWCFL